MTRDLGVYIAGNIVYVTGTVNGVVYTWTLTADHTWSATVSRSLDDVYAVHIEATNAAGTVVQLNTVLYYGLHTVTDRTATACYNTSDLNRVESAFLYLRDKMNGEFGFNLNLTIKTNWTNADLGQLGAQEAMEQYRQNVIDIRNAIALPSGTPQAPDSMRFLTAEKANDIEKILQTVETMLENISKAWNYSGEIYGGDA